MGHGLVAVVQQHRLDDGVGIDGQCPVDRGRLLGIDAVVVAVAHLHLGIHDGSETDGARVVPVDAMNSDGCGFRHCSILSAIGTQHARSG